MTIAYTKWSQHRWATPLSLVGPVSIPNVWPVQDGRPWKACKVCCMWILYQNQKINFSARRRNISQSGEIGDLKVGTVGTWSSVVGSNVTNFSSILGFHDIRISALPFSGCKFWNELPIWFQSSKIVVHFELAGDAVDGRNLALLDGSFVQFLDTARFCTSHVVFSPDWTAIKTIKKLYHKYITK